VVLVALLNAEEVVVDELAARDRLGLTEGV